MKEFFGIGGYTREVEGYMSWQHLTFVTILMIIMSALAIYFGKKYKNKTISDKNKVLLAAAILMDSLELFKIFMGCYVSQNPLHWLYNLPLFLCSIQLITIPLAALSKGRLKEASLDFVFIFGLLGAVLGTYLAGNNYAAYPVLSFDNVVSGITHSISGFCALYIGISGMKSMKRKNIPITFCILIGFGIAAFAVNYLGRPTYNFNYMFLVRGDGTPYDILFNLVNGSAVLYPLMVIGLLMIYICAFYFICFLITKKTKSRSIA